MQGSVHIVMLFSFQPPLRIDFFETDAWLAEKNRFLKQVGKWLWTKGLSIFCFYQEFSTVPSRCHSYKDGVAILTEMALPFNRDRIAIQQGWHRRSTWMTIPLLFLALFLLFFRSSNLPFLFSFINCDWQDFLLFVNINQILVAVAATGGGHCNQYPN